MWTHSATLLSSALTTLHSEPNFAQTDLGLSEQFL